MGEKGNISDSDVRARVPRELRERLDAEVKRMQREMPGVAWNQSAVIRRCLEQGLPEAEGSGE
tara:strand:- start:367 stop:555 length:189 start_codon:yes stop_codon:yes gene_type:complete